MNIEVFNKIKELQKQKVSLAEIGRILNLSRKVVSIQSKHDVYKPSKRTEVTEELEQMVMERYNYLNSSNKVGKQLGVSAGLVQKIVRKYNPYLLQNNHTTSKSKNWKKNKSNETYFDRIDTPNKAYILGFLYADGYNDEKNGSIKIGLQSSDVCVLDFISKEINCENKYECRENLLRLQINSKHMSRSLSLLGCHQRKTFTLKFPIEEQVPKELLFHFIRGYFDGDGCAYKLKRQNSIRISFSGCRKFLEKVNLFLHLHINVTLKKLSDLNKNPLSATLEYNKHNDVLKLYHYLYSDADFFLQRKFQKFEDYLNKNN